MTTQWTGNRRKGELEKDVVRKNMPEVTYYLWLGPTSERFHNLTKGCHTIILLGDPSIHKTSEENSLYLICNNRLIPFLTVTNVSVKHMHTHTQNLSGILLFVLRRTWCSCGLRPWHLCSHLICVSTLLAECQAHPSLTLGQGPSQIFICAS